MSRRLCLAIGLILLLVLGLILLLMEYPDRRGALLAETDWQRYRTTFITPEGRVVDSGNGGISHSEGQGYGMLLALGANDRATFFRIWRWTRSNLQVRPDSLFAWKYVNGQGVVDTNNATDGDILIAWALLKAGARWDGDYASEGRKVLVDIRHKLVRQWDGRQILLPGMQGFEHGDRLTVNLSYWIYPAFDVFKLHDPSPVWEELKRDGLALQAEARYGRWQLPPDWLDLQGKMMSASARSPLFGYDAIRIPLYQLWAGEMTRDQAAPYLRFRADSLREKGFLVPQVNLATNEFADYEASAGLKEVYRLLDDFCRGRQDHVATSLTESDDYFSASLILLGQLAANRGRQAL